MDKQIKGFFENSDLLDKMVLRPLSHINGNWELVWDSDIQEYQKEEGNLSGLLIDLINELSTTQLITTNYHLNEDKLAEYVKATLKWDIEKDKDRWIGGSYLTILQQGGFKDVEQENLIQAAIGRIKAAIEREQFYFDDMEDGHRKILSGILVSIVYHRLNFS